MQTFKIDPSRVAVLIIDAQPIFWDLVSGDPEPVMTRVEQLFLVADRFRLPCVATFEHPVEIKGWLPERLERVFPTTGQRFLKRTFDCCAEPEIRNALRALSVDQVVVAGAETDVCVVQSVLGLLELGFQVFVLEDCLFTSEAHPRPALDRMYRAGALPATYKMLFYELRRFTSDHPDLPPLNEAATLGLIPPEQLPVWHPAT